MKISRLHQLRPLIVLAALGAALVLAACGGDDAPDPGDLGPDPATVSPAAALLYGEVVVQPEGEQREAINSAFGKLTGEEDSVAALEAHLERELASGEETPIGFEEDIKPWLGPRAGFFLTEITADSGDGALVLSSTDNEAASSTIEQLAEGEEDVREAEHDGVAYHVDDDGFALGVVEDFVVAGPETAFEAAVDSVGGDSVADDEDARAALDSAPEGSFMRAYGDTAALIDAAIAGGAIDEADLAPYQEQLGELDDAPIVLSSLAEEDAIAIAFAGPSAAEEEQEARGEALAELPGDAWLAVSATNVGQQLAAGYRQALEGLGQFGDLEGVEVPNVERRLRSATGLEDEDLEWMGDATFFLSGTQFLSIGGGLIIEAEDERAAEQAVADLGRALARKDSLTVTETEDGLQIQPQGVPLGAEIVVRDGRVVVAGAGSTIENVLEPAETLGDSDRYNRAADRLGTDLTPAMYVDIEAIVALVESTGQATGDPGYQAAKPRLDALDYLIAGGTAGEDTATGRIVLGLQEPRAEQGGEAAAITP